MDRISNFLMERPRVLMMFNLRFDPPIDFLATRPAAARLTCIWLAPALILTRYKWTAKIGCGVQEGNSYAGSRLLRSEADRLPFWSMHGRRICKKAVNHLTT